MGIAGPPTGLAGGHSARSGTAWEVFRVFLKLGVTSFGGPVAHLGFFRDELVQRRQWLTDREYADLVALCQFLPGPASSQVGVGIGLFRAGRAGAIAAFLGFTLPSAALLTAFAFGAALFQGDVGGGLLAGLAVVAVAIVAQAVWGMARSLTPDLPRAAIAVGAVVCVLVLGGSVGQLGALVLGTVVGVIACRTGTPAAISALSVPVSKSVGWVSLGTFVLLLAALPTVAAITGSGALHLFAAFYRSGALVFGGGHVVLPLLQTEVVDSGWVTTDQFLAGYGAAQAVPGPLFTFASYLGALATEGPGGIPGALIALAGIFLPGMLLLVGVLPFWHAVRTRVWAQAAMRGANAAVVGILAAALYTPVFTTAITGPATLALALLCCVLLIVWRTPPWAVVILGAAGGILLTYLW